MLDYKIKKSKKLYFAKKTLKFEDIDKMLMPRDMVQWRDFHEWTAQRNWITNNEELDVKTFPEEHKFQEELVKISMIAEFNWIAVRR